MKKTILIVALSAIILGLIIIMIDNFEFEPKQNNQSFYPPSVDFKQAVDATLTEKLPDRIFDLVWKKTFHYSTFFESIDGFTKTAGTTLTNDQYITFLTTNVSGNTQSLEKKPLYQGLITFSQKSYFRSDLYFVNNTAQTIYLIVGQKTGDAYGFKVINGTIYGVSRNGSNETTISLGSITAGDDMNLEARYYPNDKVIFLTDSVEKGSLTTNLPSPAEAASQFLFYADITTNEAVAKEIRMSFFEYQQFRNILN